MRSIRLILTLTSAAVLSACASMGESLPKAQLMSPAAITGSVASKQAAAWPGEGWWRALGDLQLDELINKAIENSPSLAATQARIDQARALAGLTEGRNGPQLSFNAEADSIHFQRNYIYPPPLGGTTDSTGRVALDGSWELDFFGKHRAELDAALSQERAARYEGLAVAMALSAHITRSYVQLAHEYATIKVLDDTLAQRQALLDLNRKRAGAGLDAASDTRLANASLSSVRLEKLAAEERIQLLKNQLAALAGAGPELAQSIKAPALRTDAKLALPADLPVELVARRADIAAQRARVEGAMRETDVAKTLFYPNVNLTAFIGFQSIGLDKLLNADSRTLGIGPALHLPIFDGGTLRSNLRVSEAQFNADVAQYNGLIIDAVREVADAATSQQAVERQQAEQAIAQDEVVHAEQLASLRYKHGLGSELAVLAAQDRVLGQQRARIDLQTRQQLAWVDLNRALGGGFHTENNPAAH